MLVFTREEGQAFYVGEDVEITMERIEGNKVRVSVKAPRNITIARKELIQDADENKVDKLAIYELKKKVLSR